MVQITILYGSPHKLSESGGQKIRPTTTLVSVIVGYDRSVYMVVARTKDPWLT